MSGSRLLSISDPPVYHLQRETLIEGDVCPASAKKKKNTTFILSLRFNRHSAQGTEELMRERGGGGRGEEEMFRKHKETRQQNKHEKKRKQSND